MVTPWVRIAYPFLNSEEEPRWKSRSYLRNLKGEAMQSRTITAAIFLACSLQLYAQQADSPSRTMLEQCLDRPCFPSMLMAPSYEPALGGVQTSQPLSQAAHSDDTATIITFDAPGAATGAFAGTFANAINPAGVITGSSTDANGTSHGFLRIPMRR
jgi:hypothetical protein